MSKGSVFLPDSVVWCNGIRAAFGGWLMQLPWLPGAKSEISGCNVYKISAQFQDILSVSRGTRHRKCTFFYPQKCYSL